MDFLFEQSYYLHYLIVVSVVVFIIVRQFWTYRIGKNSTVKLINQLKNFFPFEIKTLEVRDSVILSSQEIQNRISVLKKARQDADDYQKAVIDKCIGELIESESRQRFYGESFIHLLQDINNYLKKNNGGICDYNIIKDIVDRATETKEDEIVTQIPIPLYLGLMGTMVGIIAGIVYFITSHGLSSLLSSDGSVEQSATGIESLLVCVALAMVASFVGVFLTTKGSIKFKSGKNNIESGKNSFLSWIQAELLPNIGNDVSGSLVKMSENLTKFNSTFTQNTQRLDETLNKVGNTTLSQQRMLEAIKELNVNKLAEANISVYNSLRNSTNDVERLSVALKQCTDSISPFTKCIENSEEYLRRVNELNESLNNAESRTKAMEEMSNFFKTELAQIQERKRFVADAVGELDVKMSNALNDMENSMKQRMSAFQKNLGVIDQTFSDAAVEINNSLKSKLEATDKVIQELQQMKALRESVDALAEKTEGQNRKYDDLISSIRQLASSRANSGDADFTQLPEHITIENNQSLWSSIPKRVKMFALSSVCVVVASCLFAVVLVIIKLC